MANGEPINMMQELAKAFEPAQSQGKALEPAQSQETKAQRAEKIRKFKESHPDKVTSAPAATQADAERVASGESLSETVSEVVRVVEPKRFKLESFEMSGINGYVTTMQFQDVVDYCEPYERLYNTDSKSEDCVDVSQRWQRGIANSRIKDASQYLLNPVHFFPPLVCVPVIGGLTFGEHVTLTQHSLGYLDGQHRGESIRVALESDATGELARESIPVVILNLPVEDIERKQQIFADVNRTPRKVSKALNLMFDHNDRVAVLSKKIAYRQNKIEGLIDFERLSPLRKSHNVMSFVNLNNLVGPMASVRDDAYGFLLSDGQVADVVDAVIDNLPHIGALREGLWTFEQLKGEYICFYSTFWQALGTTLADMLGMKDPETGERKYPAETFSLAVEDYMKKLHSSGALLLNGPQWSDPNRRVVTDKKVGTQTGHKDAAVKVLKDYLN